MFLAFPTMFSGFPSSKLVKSVLPSSRLGNTPVPTETTEEMLSGSQLSV